MGHQDPRKGGGLYLLRYARADFISLPLRAVIDDVNRIYGNSLDSPPDANFPDSSQIHLDDQVGRPGNAVDDSNLGEFISGGATFTYESS